MLTRQGLGEAGCTPFATSIIADYFPVSTRATAIAIYNLGIYTGYGGALAIGGPLSSALGWQAAYKIFGGLGLGLSVVMLVSVREPLRGGADGLLNRPVASAAPPRRPALAAREVLGFWSKSFPLLLLCLAGGIRNAGGYVWGAYSPIFFSPQFAVFVTEAGEHRECFAVRCVACVVRCVRRRATPGEGTLRVKKGVSCVSVCL
jgi:MFS family permease